MFFPASMIYADERFRQFGIVAKIPEDGVDPSGQLLAARPQLAL
jgi:hypothetical protein